MGTADDLIKRNQEKRDKEPADIQQIKDEHYEIDKFTKDGQIRAIPEDEDRSKHND